MIDEPVLSVRNLKKHYPIRKGVISRQVGVAKAVDGISFDIYPGETFGLVGESGCGKSTAAEAIIRLEEPTDGEVIFHGSEQLGASEQTADRGVIDRIRRLIRRNEAPSSGGNGAHPNDVTKFNRHQLKAFRREAQMVLQDPSSSFNPRMTAGQTIGEMLLVHGMRDRTMRREIVQDLLEQVGLSASDYDRFPHEFSGGQKQRLGLARALVLNPDLIIADEPVSALDVSIQAEILSLLDQLQEKYGLSILIISHDLSVIKQVCDRVAVMYLGDIVEVAETDELFDNPQHPYTEALLSSVPTPDPTEKIEGIELTGEVPDPSNPPRGCSFHTRCHRVIQPDGVSIEQSVWRSLMDLTEHAAKGHIDPEAIRDAVVSMDTDIDERDQVELHQFDQRLRDDYNIPSTIGDHDLDEVVSEASELFYHEDTDVAVSLLTESIVSPCQETSPEERVIGDGHRVKCHLVD